MGGNDQSTPEQKTQTNRPIANQQYSEEQEYFLLYDLTKFKAFNGTNSIQYYWIDPRIYNPANQQYLGQFRKNNLNIETFSSIESFKNQLNELDNTLVIKVISAASLPDQDFKYLTRQKRINQLFLFCMNEERANLLKQNFPQIRNVGFTFEEIIAKIKSTEKSTAKLQLNNNILLMNQQDTALMNKYRLNYHFLINQTLTNKSKNQFVSLAKTLFPNQLSLINDFVENYQINLKNQLRRQQTLQWAFKDSFFWDSIERLPKMTSDPRKLGYLRHPVKQLFDSILQSYRLIQKKPKKIFVVLSLNEAQKEKLEQNPNNFLIFTTFVKGYTDETAAYEVFKSLGERGYLFEIEFDRQKADSSLDFGFVIKQGQTYPNVIFNIYNVFQISEITSGLPQGSLKYGSLAKISFIRTEGEARNKLKQNQLDLLRNYDYLNDLMRKIKNQGNILQLSGHLDQSIQHYNKKLEQITRTNQPAALLDQYKIQKADALIMNQQYEQAQKILLQVQTQKLKVVAMIKLLQIHFIFSKKDKIEALLSKLEQNIQNLKSWGFFDEYIKVRNFQGLNLLNKQKNKEALKLYKQLIKEASEKYNYQFEGIALMHQIYRNLALSESKVKNYNQALNLLNISKGWQKCCQGRSSSLILTQRMIQSTHHLKGDKQKVEEIQEDISKRMIQQSSIDVNLVGVSRNILESKNSIMQSLIAIDLNNGNPSPARNQINQIDQSIINIDLNGQQNETSRKNNQHPPPRQIVDQSAVNISL